MRKWVIIGGLVIGMSIGCHPKSSLPPPPTVEPVHPPIVVERSAVIPSLSAIGGGTCLPQVKDDFDGVPRPNRPDGKCDIGAFQFVPSTTSKPLNTPGSVKVK